MTPTTYANIRGAELLILGFVLMVFGLAALMRACRESPTRLPQWPLHGTMIGGLFLFSLAALIFERAAFRLTFIRWTPDDWLATLIAGLPVALAVWTFVRWRTPDGLDGPMPWDGVSERRSNRERRENGEWRPKGAP